MKHFTASLICGERLMYAARATEHRCTVCGTSTTEVLSVIAPHGEPRCCGVDPYLALRAAGGYARQELQIKIAISSGILCGDSELTAECLLSHCLSHPERGVE